MKSEVGIVNFAQRFTENYAYSPFNIDLNFAYSPFNIDLNFAYSPFNIDLNFAYSPFNIDLNFDNYKFGIACLLWPYQKTSPFKFIFL